MSQEGPEPSAAAPLRTPRAAAVAGILFSLLLGAAFLMIRLSIPADPADGGEWLEERARTVTLALSLIPFAGVAFLWFIGVVRDRLGHREDRFFSSVFFGSALLFLAMVFVAAGLAAGLIATHARRPDQILESGLYNFGREVIFRVSNVYAIRMAAVFMISLGTVWLRTRTMPRWLVWLTYGLALILLFTLSYSLWVTLAFPAWVLVISVYILATSKRHDAVAAESAATGEEDVG
jgi:MFS family permease